MKNVLVQLKGCIKGKLRWKGKQGELELFYNRKNWIAHQSVETEPITQPSGQTRAYVDIGVRCPITAVIEGRQVPIAYSGNEMQHEVNFLQFFVIENPLTTISFLLLSSLYR